MADAFDLLDLSQDQISSLPKNGRDFEQDPFDIIQPEFKESRAKSIARWLYQIPSGIAQAVTYPIDLIQLLGTGSALDPEEIDQIRKISEREGIPFDEEKYLQSVEQAASQFPTQSNIEKFIEERTGAPLTPKTTGQKLLKFGSSAGKFTPGNLAQKVIGGTVSGGTKGILEEVGVPEPIADIVALPTGIVTGSKIPKPIISQKTKPSGLPIRRFEKLKEPRGVSSSKLEQINEKLESDFKKISDKIISESPVGITKSKLEENPAFKQEVSEQFKQVENLAESLPEKIHTKDVGNKLVKNIAKKKGTGFSPSEYDKDYRKLIQQFLKETPSQEIGAQDLVAQYRKNNKSLGEAYDPGRPYAFNRAKKDALLDYNKAIADVIEEKFPNSEFSNLFKETNKKWSEISDAEAIDKFIDAMFDPTKKGVQFGKGRRFFENENYAKPFKRALGEEKFKQFEQLMKDMLSSEKAAKMLKVAKQKGFGDLVETAGAFIIHPTLGKIKLGINVSKSAYKNLVNSFIDKPQIGITWERGIKNLEKGKFAEAEKDFKILRKEVEKDQS